jgi:hypothetical protein
MKIMGLPQATHRMSAQEFSAWELDEPEPHEFFRGEVFKVFGMSIGARKIRLFGCSHKAWST